MPARATSAALSLWAFSPLSVASQQPPAEKPAAPARAEVLVLGVYHMSNPGRDIVNMQADDGLAPKRQAEITEVITVLKKFHPTKVAVEAGFDDNSTSQRYADYLVGKHELTRNEREQIVSASPRNSATQGSTRWMSTASSRTRASSISPRRAIGSKEFDALMGATGDRVRAANAYLASHTVLEILLYLSADDRVAEDVGAYYRMAHFGEPWNWAGADFRRNHCEPPSRSLRRLRPGSRGLGPPGP